MLPEQLALQLLPFLDQFYAYLYSFLLTASITVQLPHHQELPTEFQGDVIVILEEFGDD
jgi:hypothetical protein